MTNYNPNLPPLREDDPEKKEEFEQEQLEAALNVSGGYRFLAFIWEILKVVIISLVIIIPIRYFIVQPFFVNGASMEDTFHDSNYILIDEVSYRFRDPVRGDIIVFRFPENQREFFIKRVVGLPGEIVEIKENQVIIFNKEHQDGFILDESGYLSPGQLTVQTLRIALDDNDYFVLGDNRLHSSDSRFWGPVNRSLITGRVFYRAWPFSKMGPFKTPTY